MREAFVTNTKEAAEVASEDNTSSGTFLFQKKQNRNIQRRNRNII